MTDPTEIDYWLAVLASLTLWGTVGTVIWAVRSELAQRWQERRR